MFTTNMQIQKWTDRPKTRKRCGRNLYIRIFGNGSKTFEMRTRQEWITLGQYPALSLADASKIVSISKRLLKSRTITTKALRILIIQATSAQNLEYLAGDKLSPDITPSEVITFDQAFNDWHTAQLKANIWRHQASARFPISAYQIHVKNHLGNLSLDKINRPLIKKFMQPLFITNSETARKLLGYMHKVFEIAYENELITGNPCPKRKSFKVPTQKLQHSAPLNYKRLPEIWKWLIDAPYSPSVKIAMQIAVITAHKAETIVNMRWQDFDCEIGIWTIPGPPLRMTEGIMHPGNTFFFKLPKDLTDAICTLPRKCDYVFTVDGLKPINSETMRRNFKKFDKITMHGFKNTFKTWALNQVPQIDAFLVDRYYDYAHVKLDKNCQRDNLFHKRAELAERYFDYCKGFEWFVRRSRT